ncbi:hypothetical protein [Dechloromonas sp. HYN0024]|uniref:hypothetical protein n=1 Tax=Dechloromonas sp. HYN0024 TaxID=2231055 RepID=UPI001F0865A7|nr:hypothetical protein [Dechloromonas sp. HYN0024]
MGDDFLAVAQCLQGIDRFAAKVGRTAQRTLRHARDFLLIKLFDGSTLNQRFAVTRSGFVGSLGDQLVPGGEIEGQEAQGAAEGAGAGQGEAPHVLLFDMAQGQWRRQVGVKMLPG